MLHFWLLEDALQLKSKRRLIKEANSLASGLWLSSWRQIAGTILFILRHVTFLKMSLPEHRRRHHSQQMPLPHSHRYQLVAVFIH